MANKSEHSSIIFNKVLEGIVRSVSVDSVIIELPIDDDIQEGTYKVSDFSKPVQEGQAVVVRYSIETVPIRNPISPEENEKFKSQYQDSKGYLDKPQRGRTLKLD